MIETGGVSVEVPDSGNYEGFWKLPDSARKSDVQDGTEYWAYVNGVKNYGVFVSLTSDKRGNEVTGLIHQSEMPQHVRPMEFNVGDLVTVSLVEWTDENKLAFRLVDVLDSSSGRLNWDRKMAEAVVPSETKEETDEEDNAETVEDRLADRTGGGEAEAETNGESMSTTSPDATHEEDRAEDDTEDTEDHEGPYCEECDRPFETVQGFRSHERSAHSEGDEGDDGGDEKKHECDDCGQKFKTAGGLGSHERIHKRDGEDEEDEETDATAEETGPAPLSFEMDKRSYANEWRDALNHEGLGHALTDDDDRRSSTLRVFPQPLSPEIKETIRRSDPPESAGLTVPMDDEDDEDDEEDGEVETAEATAGESVPNPVVVMDEGVSTNVVKLAEQVDQMRRSAAKMQDFAKARGRDGAGDMTAYAQGQLDVLDQLEGTVEDIEEQLDAFLAEGDSARGDAGE